MELGTTTRYAAQFKGRKGWINWSLDMALRDRPTLELAQLDRDALLKSPHNDPDDVRIVVIETTVREYCD